MPGDTTARNRPDRDGQRAEPRRRAPELRRRRGTSLPQRRNLLGLSSTRRAIVLALVVSALALSVAVPLRNYLSQRGELAEVQQQQERLREQVDGLEQRKAELSDPAQVEAEARRRLRYVRPGDTPYIVQQPNQPTQPPPSSEPGQQPQP